MVSHIISVKEDRHGQVDVWSVELHVDLLVDQCLALLPVILSDSWSHDCWLFCSTLSGAASQSINLSQMKLESYWELWPRYAPISAWLSSARDTDLALAPSNKDRAVEWSGGGNRELMSWAEAGCVVVQLSISVWTPRNISRKQTQCLPVYCVSKIFCYEMIPALLYRFM